MVSDRISDNNDNTSSDKAHRNERKLTHIGDKDGFSPSNAELREGASMISAIVQDKLENSPPLSLFSKFTTGTLKLTLRNVLGLHNNVSLGTYLEFSPAFAGLPQPRSAFNESIAFP